ncbi:Proteasome activator complex subunit 4 [Psilocybe cubensis]|uniref:Proteasome activator complex subunit 4 n=2 Tax=Psilocybe cubensis TaxID=181762 RepID=A0A8H8CR16_PSICU|nr:Proteasome activator complex subunit 4 [Psilocybe cubensis]KAH9487110.1 Proteasome activator complex subunit 4 [Psilocybe cubensis]
MVLPDISSLNLNGGGYVSSTNLNGPPLPDDIENTHGDRYMQKLKNYAKSLPYSIEPYSKMVSMLDFILLRLTQSVEARDYDVGFMQWDSMITYWCMLKYPIPKDRRIALAKLYFHLSITPGLATQIIATCADAFKVLTRSKYKITIDDMRLPWKPIYDILSQDLFLRRRQFEYTQLSWCMGYIADNSRKFFHPAAINDMLATFLPQFDGTKLDSILATEYYLVTFLPLSHPQYYLPTIFRVWESINSYMFDERMLFFISKLAELHVNPQVSDPKKVKELPDDEISEGEERPDWSEKANATGPYMWTGLYKDVGIFTEHEWNFLMCKCLASMEIPLADGGSLTTGPSADQQVGFEIGRLPKPQWRIPSLARIIVYSMSTDGLPVPPSNAATPVFSPLPSAASTPHPSNASLGDYLSSPISKKAHFAPRTYLAGSKALDSLARMIASTESFFHPSNSGTWTADLSAFIKYIVYDFNKRWHEEQDPKCKTPKSRRLTKLMKRELVKSLRTVVLLAMFSQDSTTVSNVQSCLKSMSVMEPDLILHPVLERAVPSLEALVETQRTISVIKALGAVAPAIVSRDVYYPGAKYLVPILELLLPGIDLNDPTKTLCTTAFLVEISQYIKIGDLTSYNDTPPTEESAPLFPSGNVTSLPSFSLEELDSSTEAGPKLTNAEEDALLKDSTGGFPDWVANFIRRVIQLLENLPEEGPNGNAGGATEVQIIDAVTGACSQICIHLSEPLYDLVLNMVFDYASTNVRTNAVRAIHQLVECVANADPVKTLAKFFPLCAMNIRTELENGASSLRTTSSSTPLPSDATLHWYLAILRGTVYNDGRAVLKYQDEMLSLIHLLHEKALSKRGYSWTGKLLSSLLLTLTHTYPLENKFINPHEWTSEEFQRNHHLHWGKVFAPDEVTISWHTPNSQEIQFAIRIFKELVEPTLESLESLLKPGTIRDAIWRSDFCRHLTLVRNAFAGTPTLLKEFMSQEDIFQATLSSDILDEIPEMIASAPPLNSGFALTDTSDPEYQYLLRVKHRFGQFLHKASMVLRDQGEENTVDAVQVLITSIRTYMLEYGDNRDSYYVNKDQFESEKNVARQYAGQKVWPRAVYVRRARFYNAARLHWNSIERKRGPVEDNLIDDLVEWSMWHYPVVRQSSQSHLESICGTYDGVRRRALPVLFDALKPGTDDDRVKGALWTINSPSFGKYAIGEPTLANKFVSTLFLCQQHEKPSIQDCVSTVFDNCLSNFTEPTTLIYTMPTPAVDSALTNLQGFLKFTPKDRAITNRARDMRISRVKIADDAFSEMTRNILQIANSSRTHWRYGIYAVKCLRTLVRRDRPLLREQIVYFLEKVHDDNPSIRYYAQRAVMKSIQGIKLRTFCTDPIDLILGRNHNPLKRSLKINASATTTQDFLNNFKVPVDIHQADRTPLFFDKTPPGWLVWDKTISLYILPRPSKSTFQPWEAGSADAIQAVREMVLRKEYWEDVAIYYSEENHETTITQDNVSTVKSIFQLLEDEPFEAFRPTVEAAIADKDQNKQRAAAEFLAGILGGSKHWPIDKQDALWKWFTPYIPIIFVQNIKSDTLSIWTSFLEYMFYNKDPRRLQPLVDFLYDAFMNLDFNSELSFDAVKVITLYRAFFEELRRKFGPWTDDTVQRCWREIHSEHEDVRAFISEIFAFSENVKWQPKPTVPTVEVLINECHSLPLTSDIMAMRGTYHRARIEGLVEKFKEWRAARVPGVRAFQSNYDRVGITVCKWLYLSLHDLHANSTFDYILPLMPEIFRFTEVNDNNSLASRASSLLIRMCGVTPPVVHVNPILSEIFDAIQSSPSWRVRLKALPLLQVFYFRQLTLISEIKIVEMLEVLCRCLDDEVVEVREMAAVTLSGILRLSPRRSVVTLKDRFIRLLKNTHIPGRQDPNYNKAIRQRHAAILGICALVDSYPYTVEKWMPELLTNILADHTYDPIPISTTVRKCASNFKRTHQDTWHEDSKCFNESQLAALSTLLTGSSYCMPYFIELTASLTSFLLDA